MWYKRESTYVGPSCLGPYRSKIWIESRKLYGAIAESGTLELCVPGDQTPSEVGPLHTVLAAAFRWSLRAAPCEADNSCLSWSLKKHG